MYVTILIDEKYLGKELLKPGDTLFLKKDFNNNYDEEAIKVTSKTGASYGYVANSVNDVIKGTHSAGYIYNSFTDETKCSVMFISDEMAIGEINDNKNN